MAQENKTKWSPLKISSLWLNAILHVATLPQWLLLGIEHDFERTHITLARFMLQIILYKELLKISDE
jgi:hypothetical protein